MCCIQTIFLNAIENANANGEIELHFEHTPNTCARHVLGLIFLKLFLETLNRNNNNRPKSSNAQELMSWSKWKKSEYKEK